ncbi:BPSL0067 family protein [Undibacterium sp. Xuan67W]|uniref:BPSL0067 family protein n=1 Tax=Undibacterium sp. Xuan67W TaxID=3413057 RepID=UPI003BF01F2E
MPYIYTDVDALDKTDKVGTGECVDLVKHYAGAPKTSLWKEGKPVKGNLQLKKGTAIATFVDGKYPSHSHGNHAAFYLSQDTGGIFVLDQWNGANKPRISKRYILSMGQNKDGTYRQSSDNADAFSIIE